MSAETLAARLGVSTFEAHEMLNQHREQFSQYWQWSDDWVQHALQTGQMRTAFDWTCRTGITEFNERSIRNWPVQADRRRHSDGLLASSRRGTASNCWRRCMTRC